MKQNLQKLFTSLLFTLTAMTAHAYDFEVDGIYYSIVSLEDMTCEVAQGEKAGEFEGTIGYNGTLEIPKNVTYRDKTFLVIGIGQQAFQMCNKLENVIMPSSITSIGESAFGNSGLKYIEIGDNVRNIGSSAFYSCWRLEKVSIGNAINIIEKRLFKYCSNLESVEIGESVTSIEYQAFFNCTNLKSISLPNSVKNINAEAFMYCSNLSSVSLGDSLITIKDLAFYQCYALTKVIMPNTITSIGECAFADCSKLTNLSLSTSLSEISNHAFDECGLTCLFIPQNVKFIGNNAFWKCEKLSYVDIGESVSEIEYSVFADCTSLDTIIVRNPIPPLIYDKSDEYSATFSNGQYMNATVYVPEGTLATYQNADVWKNFWNIKESSSLTGIENITIDSNKEHKIFDLNGHQLSKPQKGVNIIDGKKILIK